MSCPDLSGASRRAILPFWCVSACVCTGARSSPIGISCPAAITDKSGYDMINRPSITFFVRMMYLSDSTHDLVGSKESRAAFCHAQRVKCHGKEPVRVQFPQIDGRTSPIAFPGLSALMVGAKYFLSGRSIYDDCFTLVRLAT